MGDRFGHPCRILRDAWMIPVVVVCFLFVLWAAP
jgi:hypothetical protein